MPQTLLALLALSIAAFFTLGQKRASADTMDHVVKDEFELVVSGALLHGMEFADSRAFDEATTPQALRVRLGLPTHVTEIDTLGGDDLGMIRRSDFAPFSQFGMTPANVPANCNAFAPLISPGCNDLSDLHSQEWQLVSFQTPNGSPLPVQIRFDIAYVQAGSPDVVSATPTFHKRVDVYARSPILMRRDPNHVVHLRRVMSFDPVVAAEYLRRTLTKDATSGPSAEEIAALEDAAAASTAAADQARATADAAEAQARELERAASRSARTIADAEAAAAQAQQNATAAQNAVNAAQNALNQTNEDLEDAQEDLRSAQGDLSGCRRRCGRTRRDVRDAQQEVNSAQSAVNAAQAALQAAQANAGAAQQAAAQASAAAEAARNAASASQAAAAAARAAATAAEAAAQAAEAAAQEAEQAVRDAGGSLPNP